VMLHGRPTQPPAGALIAAWPASLKREVKSNLLPQDKLKGSGRSAAHTDSRPMARPDSEHSMPTPQTQHMRQGSRATPRHSGPLRKMRSKAATGTHIAIRSGPDLVGDGPGFSGSEVASASSQAIGSSFWLKSRSLASLRVSALLRRSSCSGRRAARRAGDIRRPAVRPCQARRAMLGKHQVAPQQKLVAWFVTPPNLLDL